METSKKKNQSFILMFLALFVMVAICISVVPYSTAYAATTESISLNAKVFVSLSGTTEKSYSITLQDTLFYVVETTGSKDTYLTVEGLSSGTLTDDDSGSGLNACIGFRGENKNITIKLRGYSASITGNTTLQIRKQQAAMFGFQYPSGKSKTKDSGDINTAPDLEKPASVLQSMYNIKKYNSSTTSGSTMSNNDERSIPTYNSEVLFFSGHGYYSDDGSGNKTYGFGVSFPSGGFRINQILDMSNTKIAVWAACYSANQNNAYNSSMVHKSVEKGAKAAIGWVDATGVSSSKKFTDAFFKALSEGKTVAEAAKKGKSKVFWPLDSVRKYTLVGNGNTVINTAKATRNAQVLLDVELKDEFLQRIQTGNWTQVFDSNDQIRYYKTINDCLTNDFYEVDFDSNQEIVSVTHSGTYINDEPILSDVMSSTISNNKCTQLDNVDSDELIKYESHRVYVSFGTEIVPVLIEYNTLGDSSGRVYLDTVCTNLNDGTLIDYEDIC